MTADFLFMTVLAALPVLAILGLMLGLRWPAARAGLLGMLLSLVIAWIAFSYGRTVYPELGPVLAASGALVEAAFTAATILWIIFPALCIHQMQTQGGAVEVLRASLGRLSPDPRLTALLVAWFFTLFLEGAAGFGTPVALAAPFLVGLGFRPTDAVAISLMGHAVGVSFGAVGTPVVPQVAATGIEPLEMARSNGVYHSLLGWIMALFLTMRLSSFRRKPGSPAGAFAGWSILAAILFLIPFSAVYWWVGPELPTLLGALSGGLLFALILRSTTRKKSETSRGFPIPLRRLAAAGSPYLIVVALILLTRLPAVIREGLTGLAWHWQLQEHFQGTFNVSYHPGTILLSAFLLGGLIQRIPPRDMGRSAIRALRLLMPVNVALLAMLGLSRLMVHSGMIETLAVAAAVGVGAAWPVVSPFVGVLGTFVTGSATASNILFSDFQRATAQNLGLPVLTLLGAQGFGSSIGNIVCPHNIIAGGATVGVTGQEGAVLRQTLLPCVVYAFAGGLLTWLLTLLEIF
jgi:lactate permease